MFNNLIESTSHTREFKRRGSFVLFTSVFYAVLFIVAGVASIYAYDARLEDQNLEFVTMLNPVDLPAPPAPINRVAQPARGNPTAVVRQTLMASVNNPRLVPETTSVARNENLPVPDHGPWTLGDRDSDPIAPPGNPNSNGNGNTTGNGSNAIHVDIGAPPIPAPTPKPNPPAPRTISKGVITGLALSLPKPPYPPLAKQARAYGPVNVQVLIDESGKVISAKAVSGNPMLLAAAQQAAYGARFSPTRLGEQPVKVSGVITYVFQLQ